jgi:3-hydroxypropanoate dehydrogenase
MALALDTAAQNLLFHRAHTARAFTPEPVSDEQIEEIYDLIKLAPTEYNISPLRITLVRSPGAKERLLAHVLPSNRPQTKAAPVTAILSVDLRFHEKLPVLFPVNPNLGELLYGDPAVRERQGGLNAAIQIGYFLLGVRAAGLGAGPMTGFDPDGVDKEFFGDGRQRSLVLVNIGHPADTAHAPRQPRLPARDAVTSL